MNELIEIRVYNKDRKFQYSFILDTVIDSQDFREVIDETLANGYEGWSCTAQLLKESSDNINFRCAG